MKIPRVNLPLTGPTEKKKQHLYDIFSKASPEVRDRYVWKPLNISLEINEILNDVFPETRGMFEGKRQDSVYESLSLASSISEVSSVDSRQALEGDAGKNDQSPASQCKDLGYESVSLSNHSEVSSIDSKQVLEKGCQAKP